MIQPVLQRRPLRDPEASRLDLRHWLSQPPAARIAAVELLRKQHDGTTARLQRTARVVQLKDLNAN